MVCMFVHVIKRTQFIIKGVTELLQHIFEEFEVTAFGLSIQLHQVSFECLKPYAEVESHNGGLWVGNIPVVIVAG